MFIVIKREKLIALLKKNLMPFSENKYYEFLMARLLRCGFCVSHYACHSFYFVFLYQHL